jgi:uncharacterized phage protein gp47/JayE
LTFERPTLTKLVRRGRADLATKLPGADTNLRGSFEEVISTVLAGMTHGLHGHLKWLSKQILPDLADDEFLVRLAGVRLLERTPADAASGSIEITGVEDSVCPDGTVWQRSDGALYTQDGDATIASGSAMATVVAQEAGTDGNSDVGTKLQLASPVTGISSESVVSGDGITDGVDIETIEALRYRLLSLYQSPPSGGGPGDYVNWALAVPGVTRAWEYPMMNGPGTVGVRFVMDDQESTIIPDSDKVEDVQAYIDDRAPITADVQVLAPTAVGLDFTIELTPDDSDTRDAVEASVGELVARTAEPGSTVLLSQLNEAISLATGETDHVMTVPAADVTHTANQIAVLGTITWV